MEYQILPAIIPQSLRDLRAQLKRVPFAAAVQVDVVDGQFVPFTSWPYMTEVQNFDLTEEILDPAIEVDLMVADPLAAAKDWLAVGAQRLVFHVETLSASDMEALFELYDKNQFALGLAANNDVPLLSLTQHLDWIDYVQVMGIAEIGTQGQSFDARVLGRIEALRAEHPELLISVDGSVNQETLPSLLAAGANQFVVGSALMASSKPADAYADLMALLPH